MPVRGLVIALFIVFSRSAVSLGGQLMMFRGLPVEIVHNTKPTSTQPAKLRPEVGFALIEAVVSASPALFGDYPPLPDPFLRVTGGTGMSELNFGLRTCHSVAFS